MTDLGDYPEPPRRVTGEHPPLRANTLGMKVLATVLGGLLLVALTWAITTSADSCSTVRLSPKYVSVEAFSAATDKNNAAHTEILQKIDANQIAILERLNDISPRGTTPAKRKGKQP